MVLTRGPRGAHSISLQIAAVQRPAASRQRLHSPRAAALARPAIARGEVERILLPSRAQCGAFRPAGAAALAVLTGTAALRSTPQRPRCRLRAQGAAAGPSPVSALSGEVFLWQTPLTLPAPFPAALAEVLPKHSVVLAEVANGNVAAFDFEPEDKNSPMTAFQLLSGGTVPGKFGYKSLRRCPRGAVRLGPVREGATVEDVTENLNTSFESRLSLFSNDCNRYSRAVLLRLLAEPESEMGSRLYSTLDVDALESKGKALYKEPSLAGAVTLVAGTTVGAGILALPAVTQPVGFIPSSVALVLAWLYMATTGLLIAEVALTDMASSGKVATSLQSMAARTIGPAGAAVSSLSFIIVHFGLIVAYLSRGGELLASMLPGVPVGLPPALPFAVVFGGLIFATKGSDLLEEANKVFALVVVASFAALVVLALPSAEPSRLLEASGWARTSEIAPTLLLSLVFHNVVPTVCAQLEGDRSKITFAIVVGSLVPLLMFLVWNGVILAAVAPGATNGADPLDTLRVSGGDALALGVLSFSLSAIITSFIGFVLALTDFFADALRPAGGPPEDSLSLKLRDFGLTLCPPLAVACYDPSLFFQAIDKAGAFGVSMLFGFLPAWMALARRADESPVLVQQPGFLGGYVQGPLAPGGLALLVLVAGVALGVVLQNTLELFAA